MAKTSIGTSSKKDEDTTTTYELGSGYSKSGKKLPSTAEEAIAAGRYLDDDGYWRTSSGYKLTTGHSQGGGYTSYDGVGGGYGGKNSASSNSITNPVTTNNNNGSASVESIYNYINGIGDGAAVGEKPSYTDYYDLTDIVDQLASMSYDDWTKGDQYKALADRYGLQGRMSMQDTLGQVSSRTGGLASSYATTAAQQQYNDYMSQLEDVARNMYDNERSELADQYKYMSDYNNAMYDRYRDELSDYNDALAAAQEAAAASAKATKTTGKSSDDDDATQKAARSAAANYVANNLASFEGVSPNPLYAYTGKNTSSAGSSAGSLSKSAQNILNSLETMRSQTGSSKGIENSIAVYADQGKLTDAEARYLFQYFGYDPDEWLE